MARIQHLCKESSSTSSFSLSLPAPRGKPKASGPATEQGKNPKLRNYLESENRGFIIIKN